MIILTIKEGKLITVCLDKECNTYNLISIQKKYRAGEMLVIVIAENKVNEIRYEMQFPANLTIIIYQNSKNCKL